MERDRERKRERERERERERARERAGERERERERLLHSYISILRTNSYRHTGHHILQGV